MMLRQLFLVLLCVVASNSMTLDIEVTGMKCQSCVKSIEKRICKLPGVASCSVKVGKVVLISEKQAKIDENAVKELIESTGQYKVERTSKSED